MEKKTRYSVEYEIEDGPDRNQIMSALEHDLKEFHPEFVVADYYTSRRCGESKKTFIPLEMRNVCIVDYHFENTFGIVLVLCGHCEAEVCCFGDESSIRRFNAYYNTKTQKGYISFFE